MTASTVPGPKSRKPGLGKTRAKPGAAQFMRMLAVETVPDTGLDIRFCADETECPALADAYGLVAVQTLRPVSMSGNKVRKDTRSAAFCTRL